MAWRRPAALAGKIQRPDFQPDPQCSLDLVPPSALFHKRRNAGGYVVHLLRSSTCSNLNSFHMAVQQHTWKRLAGIFAACRDEYMDNLLRDRRRESISRLDINGRVRSSGCGRGHGFRRRKPLSNEGKDSGITMLKRGGSPV